MDLLLTRYGSYVMDLDVNLGIRLINKAYEKQADKMLWDVWLARYPWMDEKSYISFEDFKKKSLEEVKQKPKEVPKTKKEIFTQAETIIKAWEKGGNKIGTV